MKFKSMKRKFRKYNNPWRAKINNMQKFITRKTCGRRGLFSILGFKRDKHWKGDN